MSNFASVGLIPPYLTLQEEEEVSVTALIIFSDSWWSTFNECISTAANDRKLGNRRWKLKKMIRKVTIEMKLCLGAADNVSCSSSIRKKHSRVNSTSDFVKFKLSFYSHPTGTTTETLYDEINFMIDAQNVLSPIVFFFCCYLCRIFERCVSPHSNCSVTLDICHNLHHLHPSPQPMIKFHSSEMYQFHRIYCYCSLQESWIAIRRCDIPPPPPSSSCVALERTTTAQLPFDMSRLESGQ